MGQREVFNTRGVRTMIKRFCIALALLLAVPVAAHAAPFHAFCPRGGTPSELYSKLDASLKADPTGHQKLAGCHANPLQFLHAFRLADPNEHEHLTSLETMLIYVRDDLVVSHVSSSVRFYSSCLRGKSSGGDDVIMQCDPQTIQPRVRVYENKRTKQVVLKGDCLNPGLTPVAAVESPCAIIDIPPGVVAVHTAFADATDQCIATRAGKPGSRDDGKGWGWFGECECNFSTFIEYTGWQTTPVGQTDVGAEGQQIRVSKTNRTDLCFEDAQGNLSDVVSVRPQDFKKSKGGEAHALVGPKFIRFPDRR